MLTDSQRRAIFVKAKQKWDSAAYKANKGYARAKELARRDPGYWGNLAKGLLLGAAAGAAAGTGLRRILPVSKIGTGVAATGGTLAMLGIGAHYAHKAAISDAGRHMSAKHPIGATLAAGVTTFPAMPIGMYAYYQSQKRQAPILLPINPSLINSSLTVPQVAHPKIARLKKRLAILESRLSIQGGG